ncbi:MAG: NAD(+)/NADH kinase, partial [Chloroflexi bacterium]|nr:NAD(+)/NADH kinase [Chloroflexota bacterium]
MALRQIGILYQSHLALATELSERLAERARHLRLSVWRRSSWEDGLERVDVSGTGLIVSVGGDGTLLRVARVAAPWGIPILGVNAGRLGYLTELEGSDIPDALAAILEGQGWVEERTMLLVQHKESRWYAMNDAVVSRGGPARVVQINLRAAGTPVTSFRGDGILIATATGSTAYNLAAGGPILPPTAPYLIAKALSPHPVSEAAL